MNKWFFTLSNLIIFMVAFYAIICIEADKPESLELNEIQVIHRDIVIPNITLTDEIKTGMFLDMLEIDISIISPRKIFESISPWEHHIKRYCASYGVDPDLVKAIIYAESKGDPFVISRDGAQGLMQLMPRTADFMGISNPFDPEENIKAGVKYIAWLVKNSEKYDDPYLLWAWNAGHGMINKKKIPRETRKFIIEVLSVKTFLKEGGKGIFDSV